MCNFICLRKIKMCRIIPWVLYGCETLSLTLNKDCKMRAFAITVLMKMFEPKREAVTGWWSKLYNEELHDMYAPPNIISVMKSGREWWAGYLPLEDSIKWILQKYDGMFVDFTHLAQDRKKWQAVVKTVMNLEVLYNVWNILTN